MKTTNFSKKWVFSQDEGDAIPVSILLRSGIGCPSSELSAEEWEEDWCFVLEETDGMMQLLAYRLNGDVEWVYDQQRGWARLGRA